MPNQIIVLSDGETWEVFDPEASFQEVLELTDEAFAQLCENAEDADHIPDGGIVARWNVIRGTQLVAH